MKILTLIVAAGAAMAGLSGAMMVQHGGGMAEHFAMIAKHLHLTPSQEKHLKSEHEAALKKLDAINADTKLDETAKDKAGAKVHADMMAKAKSVLTPEQMKQLGTIMQMATIMEKLGLSAEQKASIHTAFAETMTKMDAIHNDKKLSDSQKQAKAQELHNQTMERIHAILTPEQLEKAKQLHEGGHSIPPK